MYKRQLKGGTIPRVSELDPALRVVVEDSYGHAIGDVFLSVAPVAAIAIIAVIFRPNIPLGTKNNAQRMAGKRSPRTGTVEQIGQSVALSVDTGSMPIVADSPKRNDA